MFNLMLIPPTLQLDSASQVLTFVASHHQGPWSLQTVGVKSALGQNVTPPGCAPDFQFQENGRFQVPFKSFCFFRGRIRNRLS